MEQARTYTCGEYANTRLQCLMTEPKRKRTGNVVLRGAAVHFFMADNARD